MTEAAYPPFEVDPDRLVFTLRRRIAGRVEAIEPLVEEIMAAVGEVGCSEGSEYEIELALREALANAVRHGCRGRPDGVVEVCVACEPDHAMLIVVRDPGEGFDPAALPNPLAAENIMSAGGRGIFLIHHMMDDVHFRRGGTEVWMRRRGRNGSG